MSIKKLNKYLVLIILILNVGCKKDNFTIPNYVNNTSDYFDAGGESDSLLIQASEYLKNREIKYIVFHCAAVPEGLDPDEQWFNEVWKYNGWKNPGYHMVIRENGTVIWMLSFDKISNGVKGYNLNSLNICYNGGVGKDFVPKDTRTVEQKKTMDLLVGVLKQLYPDAKIVGHHDLFSGKACPSFKVNY